MSDHPALAALTPRLARIPSLDAASLEAEEIAVLGRKAGALTNLLKELPALEPGAMTYMMSKQGHLNDRAGHWLPHLMFYVPVKDAHTWGAGALSSGLPVLLAPHFNGAPEPVTEFMVPVSEWSDGTAASTDHH